MLLLSSILNLLVISFLLPTIGYSMKRSLTRGWHRGQAKISMKTFLVMNSVSILIYITTKEILPVKFLLLLDITILIIPLIKLSISFHKGCIILVKWFVTLLILMFMIIIMLFMILGLTSSTEFGPFIFFVLCIASIGTLYTTLSE